MKATELVAHRGYSSSYPENTLVAIENALIAGAKYIEFDVQFSKDEVPVILHDSNLKRTTGLDKSVFHINFSELKTLSAGEETRFGKQFSSSTIPSLEEVVHLIKLWPRVTAFIEIKRSSLDHFDINTLVKKILHIISPIQHQSVIISFSLDAIKTARKLGAERIGWVFEPWDNKHKENARKLSPEYLFTDYSTIPDDPGALWHGPWKWGLYEISDVEKVLEFARRGADLIETNAIGELLAHPELSRRE